MIIRTKYDFYYAHNFRLSLQYNLLYKIIDLSSKNDKFNLYAGGGLFSFINFSYYKTDFPVVSEMLADPWYLVHSGEAALLFKYEYKSSNIFNLQINFPLINNVSRPAYSIVPESSWAGGPFTFFGKTNFFWNSFVLRFNIKYEQKLNNWLKIITQYDFQYSSYSDPRNIKLYMNNFRTGINFLF